MADLSTLLASIQTVRDGDIITSEYANNIRSAINELASRLTTDGTGGLRTFTFAPLFAQNGDVTNIFFAWRVQDGIAAAKTGADLTTRGIMSIQLPDGANIQGMTVFGRRTGDIDEFVVNLMRYPAPVGADKPVKLMSINLEKADNPFSEATKPSTDATKVDNTTYKYLLSASATGSTNIAEIHAIQITCK